MSPSVETNIDFVPFVSMKDVPMNQRGFYDGIETWSINNVKVQLMLGDVMSVPGAQAVAIPQFATGASFREVGGAAYRSDLRSALLQYDDMAKREGPFAYGDVKVSTVDPQEKESGSTIDYFFNAVTVGASAETQFRDVNKAMYNMLQLVEYLPFDDMQGLAEVDHFALPFIATGTQSHLKGYQTIRASLNPIYQRRSEKPLTVTFVAYDDPLYRPIIDEFRQVMHDGTYKKIDLNTVGKKAINPDLLLSSMKRQDLMNELYDENQYRKLTFSSYDR